MMKTFLISWIVLIQINQIRSQIQAGSVFPIPLTIPNDDLKFVKCPMESGAYAHSMNCSLFHMCTFSIHTLYSCIDGFYFNPYSGKCQYFPMKTEMKCAEIVEEMMKDHVLPLAKFDKIDPYQRRKSATSECIQPGIYPDVLDCSLFHYCHPNRHHEILQCPNGLRFDPKIFMCSAPQLVNCQYEPPVESQIPDNDEETSDFLDLICRDYAPGTHLPVANKYDEYIICQTSGESIKIKCQQGSTYNALTSICEMKTCRTNANLCQNHGQCMDDLTNSKGFKCICSTDYQGEFCEKYVKLVSTTETHIETSAKDLLQFANRFHNQPSKDKIYSYTDSKIDNTISIMEKIFPTNSPFSQFVHRVNYNQAQIDQFIKTLFFLMLIFISLILLGSSILGFIICLRLFAKPQVETVGTWKTLPEESKI